MATTTTVDSAASDAAFAGPAIVSTPEEAQALIRRVSTRKKKSVVYTEQAIQDDVNEKEQDGGFESPLTDLDEEVVEKSPKKKRRRRLCYLRWSSENVRVCRLVGNLVCAELMGF